MPGSLLIGGAEPNVVIDYATESHESYFVNADPRRYDRDYHLVPWTGDPLKAAIDMGDVEADLYRQILDSRDGITCAVVRDMDDVARPQGTEFDIGAYEFFTGTPSTSTPACP